MLQELGQESNSATIKICKLSGAPSNTTLQILSVKGEGVPPKSVALFEQFFFGKNP